MRFWWLEAGIACAAVFLFSFAISRADSFQWNQASGPPNQTSSSSCSASSPCITSAGCVPVDPPLTMVPDGKTNSVVVKGYSKGMTFAYGTCATAQPTDTCQQYPDGGITCGYVVLFGLSNCTTDSMWGLKIVYAGNCSP